MTGMLRACPATPRCAGAHDAADAGLVLRPGSERRPGLELRPGLALRPGLREVVDTSSRAGCSGIPHAAVPSLCCTLAGLQRQSEVATETGSSRCGSARLCAPERRRIGAGPETHNLPEMLGPKRAGPGPARCGPAPAGCARFFALASTPARACQAKLHKSAAPGALGWELTCCAASTPQAPRHRGCCAPRRAVGTTERGTGTGAALDPAGCLAANSDEHVAGRKACCCPMHPALV
mmetsp:Transcript_21741/g.46552  ORF Transcript_21741/g.46552 Transcript_21741/m.46552 type:complete len:236 (-) Transcript_21741:400-1107(-)